MCLSRPLHINYCYKKCIDSTRNTAFINNYLQSLTAVPLKFQVEVILLWQCDIELYICMTSPTNTQLSECYNLSTDK